MCQHETEETAKAHITNGGSGKKYHYTAGNAASRNAAKRKADKQGKAIKAGGYK